MLQRILLFLATGSLLLLACESSQTVAPTPISIIPQPQQIESGAGGGFHIHSNRKIMTPPSETWLGEYLVREIKKKTGLSLALEDRDQADIQLILAPDSSLGPEAYTLEVGSSQIRITATTGAGLFYGTQSLLQLIPEVLKGEKPALIVPQLTISDSPRYPYRGMHLDVGRHMFPVDFIKRYLDYMALHKLNYFHWHLTEDQGWRIEIKAFPKLTELAAFRDESLIGNMYAGPHQFDGRRYGGYYSQEEIREVVAYAAERHISIVPEIELPGHSVAALTAYPELACTSGPFEVRKIWGVSEDIYCAGKEETFNFLEQVLSEVIELFPGSYIHIGGDEAPKTRWMECSHCQQRIQEEGLEDAHELQSYFIRRIEAFLNARGKNLIGWDEILEGGLAPNATVMSWRGTEGGIAAAKAGHDVIMTPYYALYFDSYQAERDMEPMAIGYYGPLKKVYTFEPSPPELSPDEAKHILGPQGNLWTEYIKDAAYAEYMVLPRMSALAEIAWTQPEHKNWEDFQSRLQVHYRRLYHMGAQFRIPPPDLPRYLVVDSVSVIEVESPIDLGRVRYEWGGKNPTQQSPVFDQPLELTGGGELRTASFLPDGRRSSIRISQLLLSKDRPEGMAYGLNYAYYQIPPGQQHLPDFSSISPHKTGTCYDFSLSPIVEDWRRFALIFKGNIRIDSAGTYTFTSYSDDGSRLFIDEQLVVDNDGLHSRQAATGQISLTAGLHTFELQYFDGRGGESLEVWYEGPGVEAQRIPANLLFRK